MIDEDQADPIGWTLLWFMDKKGMKRTEYRRSRLASIHETGI